MLDKNFSGGIILHMETLYDIKEMSKYLKKSEASVRKLIWERKIPYYKIGGKILFMESDIKAWLNKKRKEVK